MWQWMLLLIGFGLSVAGGTVTITYLNLVPAGLTWVEFLLLVKMRPECYLFPSGLVLSLLALICMKE
ncbi:hypothetical protein LF817_11595 [Halobacillus sp. A1]|uniref:hypothetical protein n=1 Tax=Halobacillus sp. A1 TaxID=2880262 RepID=UPI0020A678A5|nr:hypothetical protein [Halobacillus sp. A1]MCP3031988.1 hypothetical protein [Halobacillus sp. A1]